MSGPFPASAAARLRLAVLYGAFAAISIGVNLGVQWVTSALLAGGYAIIVALLAGTLAGLIVKYALDKRYIFRCHTTSGIHELRTFIVYSLLSVATTVIFWGFELGFAAVFRTVAARYLGGALGLVIGYAVKFVLDRTYTFARAAGDHNGNTKEVAEWSRTLHRGGC